MPSNREEIPEFIMPDMNITEAEEGIGLKRLFDLGVELPIPHNATRQVAGYIARAESQIRSLQGGRYYHDGHCNASRNVPMGEGGCSCYMYQRAGKSESSYVALLESHKELILSAKTLVDAMETCHHCKGTVLVEGDAVHCEDCSYDCDSHDGEECTPIYELHRQLKQALANAEKLKEGQ